MPKRVQGVCCWWIAVPMSIAVTAGLLVRSPSAGGGDAPKLPEKSTRNPWTTSRIVGSPDPAPPFKVVRAFPQLKFAHPLLMARCPGSDRLFVGEQAGALYSFADRPDAKAELFCDLRKEIKTVAQHPEAKEVEAVYALAFHPDFQNNRQCFVCYTLLGKKKADNLVDGSRVSRFTVTKTDPPRIDPVSEEIVLTFIQGGHNGCDMHFGNDGMLYISTGDAAGPNPPDPHNTGQDISDLPSSILRIDVDHKDDGKNYAIPKDNPFVAMKGARPEIWAYGFRNPWRMSFDRKTGELFVGDVGWELWEMVHRVEKGGNYGWSAMEGPQPVKPSPLSPLPEGEGKGVRGPSPIRPPLIELSHTVACSITGGLVYRGKKFPELRGAYVFGDWETRRLWAARFEGDQTKEMLEITRPSVRIVAFGEDKDGEIYFLDYDAGTVHTIERNDGAGPNEKFPTKLSQTGLFASVKDHTPAAGVTPFRVTSRQWQDGASAEHLAAFPGVSSATLHTTPKPIPGMVYWHNFRMHFPKDAVLVRTLSLAGRRIETQLLHYDGMDWRPYSFAWRPDQTDADLVPADGAEREVQVGKRTQVWQFHSRSQCMSCHNNQSEYALAFAPEQLNCSDPNGRNQLIALTEAGLLRRAGDDAKSLPFFDAASAAREPKLADPTDDKQPLEARARSYLHANCGHCHFEHGGGAVPLRLKNPVPVAEMKAVDVRPTRGDFGLPDARIIKKGEPLASTLYFRMSKFGRDRMPHLGSDLPDEAGLKLIEQWIEGMSDGHNMPTDPLSRRSIATALADPADAQLLAQQIRRGNIQRANQDKVLTAAAKMSPGPIRDLFDGYLSLDAMGPRKLGSNPRPRVILSLEGDAGRGEKLFWSQENKCGSCHKIADRGTPMGPDLTTIGKLRPREALLESLLEPSRKIEPKYAVYLVHTKRGLTYTGLLVKRNEKEVVLRDAENKEVTVQAKEVDEVRPQRISLMPDGQMAGLTPQDAADLLEYLKTRK